MKKLLFGLALLLLAAAPPTTGESQPTTCPTRSSTDRSNACASTAFVQTLVAGGGRVFNCTGVGDETAAVQAQIDATTYGATLLIRGMCNIDRTGATDYMLLIQKSIALICDGGPQYSGFFPSVSATTASSNIVIRMGAGMGTNTVIDGCFVGNPSNGSRTGLNGIYFDLTAADQNMRSVRITNNYVADGSNAGYGIIVVNIEAVNLNGWYLSLIEDNISYDGMFLFGTGDSVVVNRNAIAGGNSLYVSALTGSSATQVTNNNVTAAGGIKVAYAQNSIISGNNIETFTAPGGSDSASIDVACDAGTCYNVAVLNNLVAGSPGAGTTANVRVSNCVGCSVIGNTVQTNSTPIFWLSLRDSDQTVVGPNLQYNTSSGISTNGTDTNTIWLQHAARQFLAGNTGGSTIAGGVTTYLGIANLINATEATISVPFGLGIFKNLTVTANGTPSSGQSWVVTLRKNAADTTITCTIAHPDVACSDSTHVVTWAANDLIAVKVVASASATTRAFNWIAEFNSTP